MRIHVTRNFAPSPLASALGDLFADVAHRCAQLPEFSGRFSAAADVEVMLGDVEQCEKWHVRPDALGFHAVSTGVQYDSLEDEIRGENGWRDVNEKNEAVINISAAVELCLQHADARCDEEDDISFMISMVVTPIHEMLHVAEFLERSRGRTPLEVFDQNQGEAGLRTLLEDDGTEDRVEGISLRIAEDLHRTCRDVGAKMEEVVMLAMQVSRASRELSI